MLREQISGLNHSWAIRWYASAFIKNKLCLYPGKSLVNNIGTDGSGTHDGLTEVYNTTVVQNSITLNDLKVEVNKSALAKMTAYFKSLDLMGKEPLIMTQIIKKITPSFLLSIYRKLKH